VFDVYTTPPTAGSGLSAITVTGSGGSTGVNSGTHIHDMLLAQADRLISMNDAVSWWIDHNVFYNFVTTGVVIGGTGIAGGNDWDFVYNRVFTGPSANNTCNGILITLSAAPNIAGNKFNFNNSLTTCAMIYFNPATNSQSFEPIRIVDNSLEGNGTGIAFYNSCPSVSTCSATQITIAGNQIWTGAGVLGGYKCNRQRCVGNRVGEWPCHLWKRSQRRRWRVQQSQY
jgi:hypothetical protein